MAALLSPSAKQQFFDAAGNLASGFKLYTYAANTLTPQATYTNRAGSVANTNPIILDARGEAIIYLTPGVVYDYVLHTAADVPVWTREDVIADAGDADAVSFLQDGTGAIARSSQGKLRERVTPEDFGAAGDGVTDDTTAMQKALDFVTGGGTLYLNPRVYLISATLLVGNKTSIIGAGWDVGFAGSVSVPTSSVIKLATASDCDMIRQVDTTSRYSLLFKDFCLDGNGQNQGSDMGPDGATGMYQFNRNGFYLRALYNTRFDNVRVQNMRGSGFVVNGDAVAGCTNVYIEKCSAYNCRVYCVDIRGAATDAHINHGDFGFGRGAGIALNAPSCTMRSPVVWTSQCQDLTDPATHSSGTGPVSTTTGGILLNAANSRLLGCITEGHSGHGVYVSANADRSVIKDPVVYFVSSGIHSGLYDGISVGNASDVVIDNPVVYSQLTGTQNIRRSIATTSGHTRLKIHGGDLRRIGNAAAPVATAVVEGLKAGDVTDYSWQTGRVVAFSNSSHSIGTGFTIVQYSTEQVDDNNEYNAGTYTYTAQEYGPRTIEANLTLTAIDGGEYRLAVFLNGVELRTLMTMRAGSAGSVTISGMTRQTLSAGDTIDIRCRAVSGAVNTVAGAALSALIIRQARAE